jgi:tungstate transport system substrate-binding protein
MPMLDLRPGASMQTPGYNRRGFLALFGSLVGSSLTAGALSGCEMPGTKSTTSAPAAPATAPGLIRVMSVVTPNDSGLLPALVPDFEKDSVYKIQVSTAEDVYGPARAGKVDLVISHYGHTDVNTFVLGGYGGWPLAVFFNQVALVGHPNDPAGINGLSDAVEAFRRIARTQSTFVVNDIEGMRYLGDVLWAAAGGPAKGLWFVDPNLKGPDAIKMASDRGGYTLWGVTPFQQLKKKSQSDLQPMVVADPLLQRIMVAIVVNPQKVHGVNEKGAAALQRYLLEPATQAKVRAFRVSGYNQQLWWPAGRNNETSVLPKTTRG